MITTKAVTLCVLFLGLLGLVSGFQYTLLTQNNFDQGSYSDTTYNTSALAVQLSSLNLTGNYTSQIFDGFDTSQWTSIALNQTLPLEPLLIVVDSQDDIWKSYDGVNWALITDDYNAGDGGNDAQFVFMDYRNQFYAIEDDDDVWVSTNRGLNWTKVNDDYNSGEGQHVVRAAADYNNNLYLIEGDEDVWKSTDDGLNWTKVNGSDFNGGNGNPAGLVVNSSNTLIVVDNSEDVWASTDGTVWRFIANDLNGAEGSDVDYLMIDSRDYIYAIEDDDDIWRSIDAGFNWIKIRTDYNGEGQHVTRATIDSDNIFYIIESDEDVWKSTDDGLNWTKVNGSGFNGGNGNPAGLFSFNSTTNTSLQARSCSLPDCSDSLFTNTGLNLNFNSNRYFQFFITMTADDQEFTPSLFELTLDYIDVGYPNVSTAFPQNGTFSVNDSVSLNATVFDGRAVDTVLANLTFPNGTSEFLTLLNTSTYFYEINYIPLDGGDYIFTILVNDTSNNLNDTLSGQFYVTSVDTTHPSVELGQCSPNPSILGQNIICTATVTDDLQIDLVLVNVTSFTGTSFQPSVTNVSDVYSFTMNTSSLGAGTSTFLWTANDTSNNINDTTSGTFDVQPPNDLDGPEIFPDVCSPDPSLRGEDVTCNATIIDDVQIDIVLANITLSNGVIVEVPVFNESSLYFFTYNASLTGTMFVLWTANDSSNNISLNNEQNFTVNLPADFTPPTITIESCAPDPSTVSQEVVCNATITDDIQLATVLANVTLPDSTIIALSVSNSSDVYTFSFTTSLAGTHTLLWYANDTSSNEVFDTNQSFIAQASNQGSSGGNSGSSSNGGDNGPGALRNAAPGTPVIGNSPQPKQAQPSTQPSPVQRQGSSPTVQQQSATFSNDLTGAAVGSKREGTLWKTFLYTLLILTFFFVAVVYTLRERRAATKHLYSNRQTKKIMVKNPEVLDKLQGYVSSEVLHKLKKGDQLQQKRVDPKDKEFAHQFPETAKELQEKKFQAHPKKFNYERLEQVKQDIAKNNRTVSAVDMKKIFPETLGKVARLQEDRFVLSSRSQQTRQKIAEDDFSSHYVVKNPEKSAPPEPKQPPQTSRKINKSSKDDLLKGLQEVYKIE